MVTVRGGSVCKIKEWVAVKTWVRAGGHNPSPLPSHIAYSVQSKVRIKDDINHFQPISVYRTGVQGSMTELWPETIHTHEGSLFT